MEQTIAVPATVAVTKFEQRAQALLAEANAFQVTDAESWAEAARRYKSSREATKEVEALYYNGPDGTPKKGPIPLAKATWDSLCAAYKKLSSPFDQAASIYEQKAATWKRQEDARLEKERLEREAQARREAEDAQIAAAAAAEKAGDTKAATAIIDEPVFVPPVPVKQSVEKPSGVKTQKYYGAVVTDLRALILAAADSIRANDGKVPLQALEANVQFLNATARALKAEGPLYPGVAVVCREGLKA